MISKAVAEGLRRRGVDATAAQALPETTGLDDEEHLRLATSERRALVSFNVDDFSQVATLWFELGISHFGLVLVSSKTLRQGDIGTLLKALEALARSHDRDDALRDQLIFLTAADRPR